MRVMEFRSVATALCVAAAFCIGVSCGGGKTEKVTGENGTIAVKKVMETVRSDIKWPESDYKAIENPKGSGWYVTNEHSAEYLVRGDSVYAINGSAMTCSPNIPNVRDEKITDCPNGYIRLDILNERDEEKLAESGIPIEKRKEINYELIKYQDEHPGQAEESYGIIAKRYGITEEMITLISAEGDENDWPMPEPPH